MEEMIEQPKSHLQETFIELKELSRSRRVFVQSNEFELVDRFVDAFIQKTRVLEKYYRHRSQNISMIIFGSWGMKVSMIDDFIKNNQEFQALKLYGARARRFQYINSFKKANDDSDLLYELSELLLSNCQWQLSHLVSHVKTNFERKKKVDALLLIQRRKYDFDLLVASNQMIDESYQEQQYTLSQENNIQQQEEETFDSAIQQDMEKDRKSRKDTRPKGYQQHVDAQKKANEERQELLKMTVFKTQLLLSTTMKKNVTGFQAIKQPTTNQK